MYSGVGINNEKKVPSLLDVSKGGCISKADDLCLILPTMFVLRRRDPTDGTGDNIYSNPNVDVRHYSFGHFLKPSYNPRALCKVADESTTVKGSVSGKDDIKW